jgi:hypothetical protein
MEFLKTKSILLLSCLVVCVSCGPQQIRGESPFVSISSLTVQGETLSLLVDIRNINDVEMNINSVDLNIRVNDEELLRYRDAINISIDPSTTEEVGMDELPLNAATTLLAELESGDIASLPFSLEGQLQTIEDGNLNFKHEGHLYPIPGKPGQYRSATSRTRERR